MKRKALAIVLVAIIALALASWFVHSQFSALQNQISELQAQNKDLQEQLDARKVMITEFSSRGWWDPVGVTMAVDCKIKILNTGTSDVEGATLGIKRFGFDSDPFNITKTLGILLAGETAETQESIIISMDRYFDEFYNSSFVATLKLGNVVLDESVLQITERQF